MSWICSLCLLASEHLFPLLAFTLLDFSKDGLRGSDDVLLGDQGVKKLGVRAHGGEKGLVLGLSFDVELLVDLGGEAGHVGLQDDAKQEKSLDSRVDDLSTTSHVCLGELPRLVRLEVKIAV